MAVLCVTRIVEIAIKTKSIKDNKFISYKA